MRVGLKQTNKWKRKHKCQQLWPDIKPSSVIKLSARFYLRALIFAWCFDNLKLIHFIHLSIDSKGNSQPLNLQPNICLWFSIQYPNSTTDSLTIDKSIFH